MRASSFAVMTSNPEGPPLVSGHRCCSRRRHSRCQGCQQQRRRRRDSSGSCTDCFESMISTAVVVDPRFFWKELPALLMMPTPKKTMSSFLLLTSIAAGMATLLFSTKMKLLGMAGLALATTNMATTPSAATSTTTKNITTESLKFIHKSKGGDRFH